MSACDTLLLSEGGGGGGVVDTMRLSAEGDAGPGDVERPLRGELALLPEVSGTTSSASAPILLVLPPVLLRESGLALLKR